MIGAAPPHGLAPARLGHGWFADFPDFRCGCKMHYLVHAAFGKAGGYQTFAAAAYLPFEFTEADIEIGNSVSYR